MNKQKVVLLIEDNEEILKFNKEALLIEDYKVLTALTLNEARNKVAGTPPDAIILDIMLPDGNGLEFCAELRERTDAPIIFLTCLDGKEPLLKGLKSGGDDYITKPYDIDELLARVGAQLRKASPPGKLTRGPLALDLFASKASLNGEDMMLAQKEFALLSLLVQNEGKPLTKEYLYETAWGQPMAGDGRAVWVQLSRLKTKLEAGSGGKISIAAHRGKGYALAIEK